MTAVPLIRPVARARRPSAATVLIGVGLLLIALGAVLPWASIYAGLEPIPGFLLDGGALAGLAVAAAGLLVAAVRLGGGRLLRPVAAAAGLAVAADAAYSALRIGAFVADPGPAGALSQPSSGPGAIVMAAGGIVLLAAAAALRPRPGRLSRRDASRLLLSGSLLLAAWIHLLLVPEHLAESPALGVGFLAAGAAQALLAIVVLLRPSDAVALAVVAVSAALLALYAWAVAVGLPIGGLAHEAHESAGGLQLLAGEPVDLAGGLNALAELAALAIAFTRLGGPATLDRPRRAD